ncbi:LOW QUALITY PROTEIN: hypothetical protein OSB04_016038 [Centaurea solstitialis]|uniref:Plant basic secretory protein (BSP) family protein n=1 Tax=Centaurea solstitialis TaxID=347529 RepID=A0AA38TK59_9ASTR|nr:LOW QUALITY PROTEIN: hypothetical protein OSB04_016038 [Centaurea solstitialis]
MAHKISFFLLFLAILATLQLIAALDYTVQNPAATTPGGIRFTNDIGVNHTIKTLSTATAFIWKTFQQNTDADKKKVARVGVFIDDMDGVAYAMNDNIHVSAKYIKGFSGDVKTEITGVLYHEMTHVWQWNGKGHAPGGLIEGDCGFREAGYAPRHWVQPGQGNRWDQGYDVTARFLDYCNGLRSCFIADLNKKMRDGYSDKFFVDLLGKTVDQLWTEYKAKH